MSNPATPSSTSSAAEKTFSSETVAVLIATLLKVNPNASFNYAQMSAMSSLTSAPLTKATIDHQFRGVKKRALELIAREKEIVEGGGAVEEVKAAGKRGASSAVGDSSSASPAAKKQRVPKPKTEKVKQEVEDGADGFA